MTTPTVAPYGSWQSPISAALVASTPIYLTQWIAQLCAEGETLYGLFLRPEQGGRGVVARFLKEGDPEDLTPAPFSVRTRVYEYGGPSFVVHQGVIYFSNYPDDRLYRHQPGTSPHPITADGAMRYGDLIVDPYRQRVICVREDRTRDGEPQHTIAAVNFAGDQFGRVLFDQTDFVSRPALSHDGRFLAWMAWNHPNMRFFISSLWVADVQADGSLANARPVVIEANESILDLYWSPDGALYFLSDRDNWWNLYRWRDGQVTPVCPMAAEFGRPFRPVQRDGHTVPAIAAMYRRQGIWYIGLIDVTSGQLREFASGYTFFADLEVVGESVYVVAASPTEPLSLLRLDPVNGETEVVLRSSELASLDGYLSIPTQVGFPTENGLIAYGYYYPPSNRDFVAPAGQLPPLIVAVHGGPTSAFNMAFNLGTQYWTSRGFAVLEVDYGGSTGYGRAYRQRLWGQWGIVDVADAVNGARYLVEQGLVDGNRTIIRGGSAGGFTTFAALAFRDFFQAGSSHFGISDLETWHRETHKYESHYCETLIGPYPEQRQCYRDRSPVNRADAIDVPMILFQGLDDKVVPPNQSRFIVDALRRQGVPVVYVEFEGEAHGFRRFETNVHTLQVELAFFGHVLGFVPAGDAPALKIA
ncbi:MAG: prolyl oligopeptidase family serine peptidase [Ardenticatenaceae bacterium]|nr:prolyl oligopeptidase family serine peptidase [Ardenticatenaceae bacterium]